MAKTGLEALVQATRELLLTHPVLAAEEVAQGMAERADKMPYVIFNFKALPITRHLGPTVTKRAFRGEFKVCTDQTQGMDTAEPLKDAIWSVFSETVAGLMPHERLNMHLNPLGWSSQPILETEGGEIEPYHDYVGEGRDIPRWHTGVRFDFHINKIS